jgi:hypothetical protein
VCIRKPLGHHAILAVHTQDDGSFERIGQHGYTPARWGAINSTHPSAGPAPGPRSRTPPPAPAKPR